MILALAYHSISDCDYDHAVTPERFRWQLKKVQKHFTIVSTQEFVDILSSGIVPEENYAVVTFDDGLEDNYTHAFPILKELNIPATIFMVTSLEGKDHTNPEGMSLRFLSWEQMREMQESGLVSIETHTHTHRMLTQLSEEEVSEEIVKSKELLQKNVGVDSSMIAFPKGNYDDRVNKVVSRHMKASFGPLGTLQKGAIVDMHLIPRVIISRNIASWKFFAMMNPLYWRLKAVRDKHL